MLIAQDFIGQGYAVSKVLKVLSIASSSYYYIPKDNPRQRGKKKSTHTRTTDGKYVSNSEVLKDIEKLLGVEFVDYGYRKVTHWLRQNKKYIINEKKVYRLMASSGLLNKKKKNTKSPRLWVSELVPDPSTDFEYLEFDIKYVYIAGKQRNAMVLSIIDVSSRWLLGQYIDWTINQFNVKQLFEKIFEFYDFPKVVYVRNDNGTQFVANEIRKYFNDKNVIQEFTKPATPEQNAHIESYHSIMENVICQKYSFENLNEAHEVFNRWIIFYNFERIHSGIKYLCPAKYLANKGFTFHLNDHLKQVLDARPKYVNLKAI